MSPQSKLMAPNAKANPIGDVNSAPNSTKDVGCFLLFAASAAWGAFMGSIYGFDAFNGSVSGAGLVKKKGFKGSFIEARSNAKTFAILSGVESLVVCIMAKLRGKHDAINAGVAGCCTGLTISFPGAPKALVQSCLTFGALSFMIEVISKQQQKAAFGYPIYKKITLNNNMDPPWLFHLQFPLPNEMKGPFSSFHHSLKKRNKAIFPPSH
ncbi:hypothetical protein VNO77_43085 [Canavalia gladiata]|uniref:Mitochondrial import inner membrane translocase subunit TIM22 n=1 Tax=Canavalia gladiata TaxID=3824 RepID=A0AAN9JX30_CANGL